MNIFWPGKYDTALAVTIRHPDIGCPKQTLGRVPNQGAISMFNPPALTNTKDGVVKFCALYAYDKFDSNSRMPNVRAPTKSKFFSGILDPAYGIDVVVPDLVPRGYCEKGLDRIVDLLLSGSFRPSSAMALIDFLKKISAIEDI